MNSLPRLFKNFYQNEKVHLHPFCPLGGSRYRTGHCIQKLLPFDLVAMASGNRVADIGSHFGDIRGHRLAPAEKAGKKHQRRVRHLPIQRVRKILRGQQMFRMRDGREPQIRGNVQVL